MPTPADDLIAVPRADLQELIDSATREWLSVERAAAYADVSVDSIRRLIAAGKLTPHRLVRGKILISRTELDAAIRGSAGRIRNGRGQIKYAEARR